MQNVDQVAYAQLRVSIQPMALRQYVGVAPRVAPRLSSPSPRTFDPNSRLIVDHLTPDYRIIQNCGYEYGLTDAYLGYATRGCPNKCAFCAVNRIEPEFVHYLPLKRQVKAIEDIYGAKRHLVLLDNNVLASERFEEIIGDILDLGFEKGARLDGRMRRVDFNQGIDARRLTREKMHLLAKTAIKPLRLAFDDIRMKDLFVKKVKLARDCGILNLSTYVLFNYADRPQEFYERLRLGVTLNRELGTKISSFPMKFIPLDAKDRHYVGPHWNRQLIRGVQCILLATHGMVSPRLEFFEAAFGRDSKEFIRIALMPEEYIIYRRHHEANGAYEWGQLYDQLTPAQHADFVSVVSRKRVDTAYVTSASGTRLKRLLEHYLVSSGEHS